MFTAASALHGAPLYEVEVVAARRGTVRATGGVEITAGRALTEVDGPVDTFLVTGGLTFGAASDDRALIEGIRHVARRARRVGSVCSGAFLLAEAGLLDNRTVTTHWAGGEHLTRQYPGVRVEPDRIYVEDDGIWTSAGVTAGIDLALALVSADHGPGLAREVSRWLVVYLHRPGGQSQFSAPIAARPPRLDPLRALQIWIEENLTADLTLDALARQVGMSTRHFSRVFAVELGVTPARYVEQVRVAAARRLLETTDQPVDRIAVAVGLHRAETLNRTFHRRLGVTPGAYRARFARPAPSRELG